MANMDIREQLSVIKRGSVSIVLEEELKSRLQKKQKLRIKLGVDPTAPDIHLGFTVVLRKLRQFQDMGHQAVLIIGDYTAMLGDPSGRTATRPQLTHEEVMKNAQTYQKQFFKILDKEKTEIHFNGDWFSKLPFSEVIKLAARTTVARMLEHDYFANRYEKGSPIGLHEFIYPLMQAYDSLQVRADVELGATDQIFNVLMGRDLQKESGQIPQVGIFMPILQGLDGKMKMSKSLGNYIGIDESPGEMFGKMMSIPDGLMKNYFELLTDFPLDELKKLIDSGTNPRDIKKRLGKIIVGQYHGENAAIEAEKEFEKIFQRRENPSDVEIYKVPEDQLKDGKIWLVKLLTESGLVKSKTEAQRLIKQGAIEIDGKKITAPDYDVPVSAQGVMLKAGKRNFRKIQK